MSRFRKVDPRIWNDAKFMSLSDDSKLVFFMILTHPHLTMLGAMRATKAGLAEELDWEPERFAKRFAELSQNGLVNHDQEGKLVWVPNFLKYNSIDNPNQVKAAFSAIDLLPECKTKDKVLQSLKPIAEQFRERLGKGFGERFGKQGEGEGAVEGEKTNSETPFFLPLKDGTTYTATEDDISIWSEAHPNTDLKSQFVKMRSWLHSNEDRLKTRRGIKRFVNSWLDRNAASSPQEEKTPRQIYAEQYYANQ